MGLYRGTTPQDGPGSGWGAALFWVALHLLAIWFVLQIWESWL